MVEQNQSLPYHSTLMKITVCAYLEIIKRKLPPDVEVMVIIISNHTCIAPSHVTTVRWAGP